ncbi:MAG: DinB family protein [Bacteroidota bacterium]
MLKELIALYDRDLTTLRKEIELYSSDSQIWKVAEGINNPGGNIFLHLMGNLNTFFGSVYGNTGYVRDRPLEFSLRDVPRSTLLEMLEEIHPIVIQVLRDFPIEQLGEIYPIRIFDEDKTNGYIFIHLETHLAYHLGQINYHRRLLDS